MSTISLSSSSASSVTANALVVGVAKGPGGPVLAAGSDASTALRGLTRTLAALGATGAAEELTRVPAPAGVAAAFVVAVGLGERRRTYDSETLRRAAGAAARSLAGQAKVALALPAASAEQAEAVATGALLGAYAFDTFRTKSAEGRPKPVGGFVLVADVEPKAARAALVRAKAVASAMAHTRDLVNTPPNVLTPAAFAAEAERVGRASGLEVTVLDEKQLKRGGYGGIMGVGQGSEHPPRLVRIAYRHPKATRHLALVGKGITFDSGGISIKPGLHMEVMKSDMAGAAAVLSVLTALATLKPVVNVTGWAAMAENMPSGSAQRPSDVLTTYGGRTVEVLNTDAEGRLVLADAMVRAAEENPDLMVDVATLTGAQIVALGGRTGAIMSNDDTTRDRVFDASKRAGEAMWPMPLPEELRKGLDSPVADIANLDNGRMGGMLSAGVFLRDFVAPGLNWAHLDIAGPSFNTGAAYGYTPSGGTGSAVRTLLQVADDMAAGKI